MARHRHRRPRRGLNGYDTTIKYGGEDKEFGIRLGNAGITGRHLRYTAPLFRAHTSCLVLRVTYAVTSPL